MTFYVLKKTVTCIMFLSKQTVSMLFKTYSIKNKDLLVSYFFIRNQYEAAGNAVRSQTSGVSYGGRCTLDPIAFLCAKKTLA